MSKKFILISALILTLSTGAFYFYALGTTKQIKTEDIRINQILEMRDINNNRLKNVATDFIIINFWASWCPPCVEETPSLIRFTQKHAAKFTLIALSQDTTKKEIEDFIKTFPALKSNFITIIHDDSQSVARSFKTNKLPETFIYSVKQNKFFQVAGAADWDQPLVVETLNKFFNTSL